MLTVSLLDITLQRDSYTLIPFSCPFCFRNTASIVTKPLRIESHFATPELDSEKIFGFCGLEGPQEVASCVTKGTEVEIHRGEFHFSLTKLHGRKLL